MAMTPNVNFRIGSVIDPTRGAQQALTSVGQLMQQRQANADKEATRQDLLTQRSIENERANQNLLLSQNADERAQTQLGLLQDKAAMDDATRATQQFTNEQVASILSEPNIGKRQTLLKEYSAMGGFNPDANAQKLLLEATTPAQQKEQTGTVTIGKDGKYSTVPVGMLSKFQQEGWTVGKPFKGDGSGNGSSKKKDSEMKGYNALYKRAGEYSSSILGMELSDDTSVSRKTLQKMEATGISSDIATRAVDALEAVGGDLELSTETLNDPSIMPPVYDPNTGKSMPFGDALESAFTNKLAITVDDKGRPVFAPKTEEKKDTILPTVKPKKSNKPLLGNEDTISESASTPEYNYMGQRVEKPQTTTKVKDIENTSLFKALKRQYPNLSDDRLLDRYNAVK